jgi:hypothetical protein
LPILSFKGLMLTGSGWMPQKVLLYRAPINI